MDVPVVAGWRMKIRTLGINGGLRSRDRGVTANCSHVTARNQWQIVTY